MEKEDIGKNLNKTDLVNVYEYLPLEYLNSDDVDSLYSGSEFLRRKYLTSIGKPTNTTKDELIKLIIKERIIKDLVDIDKKDEDSIINLMEYIQDDPETLEILIDKYKNIPGILLRRNQLELMDKLLDIERKRSLHDSEKFTDFYRYLAVLLNIAIQRNYTDMIKLLVRNGAPFSEIIKSEYVDSKTKKLLIDSSPLASMIFQGHDQEVREYVNNPMNDPYYNRSDIQDFANYILSTPKYKSLTQLYPPL